MQRHSVGVSQVGVVCVISGFGGCDSVGVVIVSE